MKYAFWLLVVWLFGAGLELANACETSYVQDCPTCATRVVTTCKPLQVSDAPPPAPMSGADKFQRGMNQFERGMKTYGEAYGDQE